LETLFWNGSIIDQNVLLPEQDRRSEDGIGQAGLDQSLFQDRFASEVLKLRFHGGVGDADMDDPLDASLPCGVEESEGVSHGIGMLELAVIESHPVGVVEDRDALQVLGQETGLVEMERVRLDAISERIHSGH
jgi:hypothetical protein